MSDTAVYYTTGTTNRLLAAAVLIFLLWTLHAARSYVSPRQAACQRDAAAHLRLVHPATSGLRILGPVEPQPCADCGFVLAADGILDGTPGCREVPCERCLWGDE